MPAKWEAHPLKCTRSARYPCLPNAKHTRSSAPAEHCIHACQMVGAPVQVHPLSTVKFFSHPFKCTRSALYPCLPNGKHTRSSAPAQHCIHACQMVSAPVQVHPLSTVSMPASSAPVCILGLFVARGFGAVLGKGPPDQAALPPTKRSLLCCWF